jgi:small conductance mechanosensitive channel
MDVYFLDALSRGTVLGLAAGFSPGPLTVLVVSETLRQIASEMREDPRWRPVIRDDLDVMGVDRLGDSGVVMRVRLKTEPSQRWAVAREMNRRIKRRFDELGIEIPYPHQKLVLEEKHPAQTASAAPEPPAATG